MRQQVKTFLRRIYKVDEIGRNELDQLTVSQRDECVEGVELEEGEMNRVMAVFFKSFINY